MWHAPQHAAPAAIRTAAWPDPLLPSLHACAAPLTCLPAVLFSCSRVQDLEAQVARKKRRNVNKAATRSVAGASLEVIQKKKSEKPEARKASREAALR